MLPDVATRSSRATVTSRAVTPIAGTIYDYSGGQLTQHTVEDQLRHQIELFGGVFRANKVMIEAQRKVIHHSPDQLTMTLPFDCPVGQFRRSITALMEREAKSTQAA